MGRIETRFADLHSQHRKAFVAYITAGDPSLTATMSLVRELEKNFVDIIELGIPFSDPIADGPVNQQASMRALKNNVTLGQILDTVQIIRKESQIPIIFFTYLNTILSYGMKHFVDNAADTGVDGALVLDLPPEEAEEYKQLMDSKHLATVFLVSPITASERLELITRNTTGFIYYVSQMGVTGEREHVAGDINEHIRLIRSYTSVPVVVGFGISTSNHVRTVAQYADGVVVGSSIVKRIGELSKKPGFEKEVGKFVGTLTAPLKGA